MICGNILLANLDLVNPGPLLITSGILFCGKNVRWREVYWGKGDVNYGRYYEGRRLAGRKERWREGGPRRNAAG